MPISPPQIYSELNTFRVVSLHKFGGWEFDRFALSVANAVSVWLTSVQLQGLATGTAGVGSVAPPTTKVLVPPNPSLVTNALAAAGIRGSLGVALGQVLGLAIPLVVTTFGQYTGGAVGVGIGADVSKVTVANPAILSVLLTAHLAPSPAKSMMVLGLSQGLSALLLAGTGLGSVVGSPSIVPGAGPTSSVMV